MFTDDLAPFFAEFSSRALLGAVEVRGIVEAGYDNADLVGYGAAAGSSPTFLLRSAQVPPAPEGQPLQILTGPAAGTFRVTNAFHDGTGVCRLSLIA